ncbi:MAG: hypothetical protein U1E58_02010 [Tabrizicola sp.]
MDEELDEHTLWNCRAHDLAHFFAKTCAELRSTRPVPEADELHEVMISLVTDLWDQNFSITDIRRAFQEALQVLPRYAAGYDSRSLEAAALAAKKQDKRER